MFVLRTLLTLFLDSYIILLSVTQINLDRSGSEWLRVVPWGLKKLLNFIKDNYDNPPVYITENGMSDRKSSMQDGHRIYYYKRYINNVLRGEKNITTRCYPFHSLHRELLWCSLCHNTE